jgi:homoserine kinase type II
MAVYTEVSEDDLTHLEAQYGIGQVTSLKGIAEGVENTNYLLAAGTSTYILTLYERRVAASDLPFFLGLMDHLAARGLTCPTPLRTRSGAMLTELAGRPAALVTFLEGVWLRNPNADHCWAVGAAMAKMHAAATGFALTRRNALDHTGWRILGDALRPDAERVLPGLGPLIADELDAVSRDWPVGLPAGIIHADLFPNNVFFLGEHLSGLIDFYFACNDVLAYDLAIGLIAWCFDDAHRWNAAKGKAMVAGYQSVRQLSAPEYAALPVLARGAALRFLLTRAYDWLHTADTALVKRLDPREYRDKLAFLQTVKRPEHLGLVGS